MTRKTEVGIAVGVIVLLIVVVLAIMMRQRSAPVVTNSPVVPTSSTSPTSTTPQETPAVPVAPPVANPETTTMIFVERFSSFSSESNFANVTDVLPLVTTTLASRLQASAANQQVTGADKAYYGISTKVITQKTQEQADTTATILVSTQRAESIGSPGNTTVRYQDIRVYLVKEGDAWKVNDYSWGE